MVGYIDDATVSSQLRVRFDAGFNDNRPDRGEYFYAGSSMPFRWIQPTFFPSTTLVPDLFDAGGISDVQSALKFAAIASGSIRLTPQLTATCPTGDGAKGLGTNHYSIAPMLLYSQRLTDRAAIEAEAGDSHPIGGTLYTPNTAPAIPQNFAGDVFLYGVGPSYRLIDRDTFSFTPVLELVAWHFFGGLETGAENQGQSAAGTNILNLKLGARAGFQNGGSIYAGYGRGVTSQVLYKNLFRVEYRYAF